MPKIARDNASTVRKGDAFCGRYEDLGGFTVAFESYFVDADLAALFAGLPDDRCQCPHWGVVVKGTVHYRYADREETIDAGETYYAPPGHTPVLHAGTEVIEFSPTEQLQETMAAAAENARALGFTA